MLKKLLLYAIPFVLPFLLYALYAALFRVRGGGAQARRTPWVWLSLAGIVLVLVSVGIFALNDGHAPGGDYQPPRVENGEIVPGGFRESE